MEGSGKFSPAVDVEDLESERSSLRRVEAKISAEKSIQVGLWKGEVG